MSLKVRERVRAAPQRSEQCPDSEHSSFESVFRMTVLSLEETTEVIGV